MSPINQSIKFLFRHRGS